MLKIKAFKYITAPTLLVIAIMACNLPSAPTPAVIQPTQELPQPTQSAPIAPTEPAPQPAAEIIQATQTVIQTNLPTMTLEGGTGYIFSTGQTSKDDRDIWWNAVQFVPNTGYRWTSLGIISSPSDVIGLTFTGQSPSVFEPVIGEGYGMEIIRNNETKYAVIRVINIDSDRKVTFDWVYPFAGPVTINP